MLVDDQTRQSGHEDGATRPEDNAAVRWRRERTELFIAIMTEQYPKMLLNDDPSDDLPIWREVDKLLRERIKNEEMGDDHQTFLSNISIRQLQKKWDNLIDNICR